MSDAGIGYKPKGFNPSFLCAKPEFALFKAEAEKADALQLKGVPIHAARLVSSGS